MGNKLRQNRGLTYKLITITTPQRHPSLEDMILPFFFPSFLLSYKVDKQAHIDIEGYIYVTENPILTILSKEKSLISNILKKFLSSFKNLN